METLLQLGLMAYIAYLPICLGLFIYDTKEWRRYNIITDLVCELGISTRKSHALFSFLMISYGLLSLFLGLTVSRIVNDQVIAEIIKTLLLIVGVSTMFVGIYPMNLFPKRHLLASGISFGLGCVLAIISAIYIPRSAIIPQWILAIDLLMFILVPVYGFTFYSFGKQNLNKVQKVLVSRKGEIEWIIFVLTVMWNFSLALVVLANF